MVVYVLPALQVVSNATLMDTVPHVEMDIICKVTHVLDVQLKILTGLDVMLFKVIPQKSFQLNVESPLLLLEDQLTLLPLII